MIRIAGKGIATVREVKQTPFRDKYDVTIDVGNSAFTMSGMTAEEMARLIVSIVSAESEQAEFIFSTPEGKSA